MSTTEPTTTDTGERVVVIPEITVPATSEQTRTRIFDLLEEVMPHLEKLHSLCMEVRDANDQALVALYPVLGGSAPEGYFLTDEMTELAGKATGCRDGMEADPFTPAELAGLRRALRFHDSTGTVPRLVATIDEMTRDRLAVTD